MHEIEAVADDKEGVICIMGNGSHLYLIALIVLIADGGWIFGSTHS